LDSAGLNKKKVIRLTLDLLSRPMPLAADEPRYGTPLPQYQLRYDDDRPPLPFPFFFGR
jgi:hypothetical protein